MFWSNAQAENFQYNLTWLIYNRWYSVEDDINKRVNEICKQSNIFSPRSMRRWLNGTKPTFVHLLMICAYFDVDVYSMLFDIVNDCSFANDLDTTTEYTKSLRVLSDNKGIICILNYRGEAVNVIAKMMKDVDQVSFISAGSSRPKLLVHKTLTNELANVYYNSFLKY